MNANSYLLNSRNCIILICVFISIKDTSYHCCAFFSQKNLLNRILKTPVEHVFHRLMLAVGNPFELCLAKCRTSSQVGLLCRLLMLDGSAGVNGDRSIQTCFLMYQSSMLYFVKLSSKLLIMC